MSGTPDLRHPTIKVHQDLYLGDTEKEWTYKPKGFEGHLFHRETFEYLKLRRSVLVANISPFHASN
jgi:hypothetical protein